MLRLAALLAPVFMVLAAQPAAAQVFAKVSSQNAQSQVIALLATGTETDKRKLEAVAKTRGYKTGRSKNAAGEDEVMIMVPDGGDHDQYWAFYDELKAGKYGALKFDMIVLPLDTDSSKDGYLDKARVWGASYVTRPAPVSAIMGRAKGMTRPAVVLGIIGTGKEAEMARLEAACKAAGYTAVRSKGSKGEPDVMVIVRRSDNPAKFGNFYRQAVRGNYGKLAIELILVPQQYDPAASDYLDHAKVFSSSQIIEP
jgi:hypothetical protein